MTKAEIIAHGLALASTTALTSSATTRRGDGERCGHCDSCLLRLEGFAEAGQRIRSCTRPRQ